MQLTLGALCSLQVGQTRYYGHDATTITKRGAPMIFAVVVAFLLGIGVTNAQSAPPTSTAARVFTEEQAKSGAAAFQCKLRDLSRS